MIEKERESKQREWEEKTYRSGTRVLNPSDSTNTHSVLVHPLDDGGHRFVCVDVESAVLGHARQLHVIRVQLLLHHLLQRLERQYLRLGQRQGPVVLGLELGLGTFGSGSYRFGVVLVECSRRLGVVSK